MEALISLVLLALGLGLVTLAIWAAYRIGRRHEAEDQAEQRDHMSRVEPPERTPGQPTNLDSPPSVVRDPIIRGSRWSDEGDVQR